MSQYTTITIPANSVTVYRSAARVFSCIDATAEFKVRPDNGANIVMNKGRGFGSPNGKLVNALTFYNPTAAPLDVTFYWGNENFRGDLSLTATATLVSVSVETSNWTPAAVQATVAQNVAVALVAGQLLAQRAIVRVPKGNTGVISLGPSADANFAEDLGPESEYVIEAPTGKRFNLAQWFYKSSVAGESVKVIYVA